MTATNTKATAPATPATAQGLTDVIEHIRSFDQVEILTVKSGSHTETQVAVLPSGKALKSLRPFLEEHRPFPEFRQGTASLQTLESLIDHINRFKDADSVVFASQGSLPSITAVLDYHKQTSEGQPRHGRHRSVYGFPMSDEWKAWKDKNNVAMSQGEFAEFLEDRIVDVLTPPSVSREEIKAATGAELGKRTFEQELIHLVDTLGSAWGSPSKLIQVSRNLQINATEKVQNAIRIESGEAVISYAADHGNVNVPSIFLIGIPVFKDGALYKIPVRLRYRLKEGAITWFYELYRTDKVLDHAFKEACGRVQKAVDLPLLYGSPEVH